MPNSLRSPLISAVLLVALPSLAQAHPGHDGHEFTWDFSHLAAHPIATAGCLLLAGAGAWLVWRLTRRLSTGVRAQRSTK